MQTTFLPGHDHYYDESDMQQGAIQVLTKPRLKLAKKVFCVGLMVLSVFCIAKTSKVRSRRGRSEYTWEEEFDENFCSERTTTKRIDENTYLRLFGGPEGRLDTITLN